MYIIFGMTFALLAIQYAYVHFAMIMANIGFGLYRAGYALLHPSVTSPLDFMLLATLVGAMIVLRVLVVRALTLGLAAAIPIAVFIGAMNVVMPPAISGHKTEVGTIEFHDWSGIFQKRDTDEFHVSEIAASEQVLGPPAVAWCRRLIDSDTTSEMKRPCAVIACDRMDKGTIDTDPLTKTDVPAKAGTTRNHSNLSKVCSSIRYH